MAANTNVSIDEQVGDYIDGLVQSGRYADANDVIRDSLQLLEERENGLKLEILRHALEEGELSGEPEPFDLEDFLAETRKPDYGIQVKAKGQKGFTGNLE